jgi:hypothetical protein
MRNAVCSVAGRRIVRAETFEDGLKAKGAAYVKALDSEFGCAFGGLP